MEGSTKKSILIGLIVVCLAAAGVITYKSRSKKYGIESIKRGEMIWLKCSNPDCGHEYQMDKRDYYQYLEKHVDPILMKTPALPCPKCGQESVYRAVKCSKCGTVFFYGAVKGDFPDRCPNCSYSQMEEDRKKAKARRAAERMERMAE